MLATWGLRRTGLPRVKAEPSGKERHEGNAPCLALLQHGQGVPA
jgi:hypothetical protein